MTPKKGQGPDMTGLGHDWRRYQELREEREEAPAEPEKEAPADPVPARKPGRSRGGRRPAPAAAEARAATVRLDPEEAAEVDRWILDLRDDARRARLDKAEVYRELVRLAREDPVTRRKLLRRL